MHEVRADFRERAKELLTYLRHVKHVSDRAKSSSEQATAKSLRAAGYLLAYNLVEATARNALKSVFDHLRIRGVGFDELRNELKLIVLRQARRLGADDLANRVNSIATDIVTQTFDSELAFSGNVDARELRKTAKSFGYQTNRRTAGVAESLLVVKTNRNDLAHGTKTFGDIGRDTTVEDLRQHSLHVILYMREVIRHIDVYLEKQCYLAVNAS